MKSQDDYKISVVAIIKRLWSKKLFIIYIVGCFLILGVIIALASPIVYTSTCSFIPQYSNSASQRSMSSIAALTGINLGGMTQTQSLSPNMYPQVFDNIDFQKELMYSKIKFQDIDEPITLIDYYFNPKYQKQTLLGTIRKYTIGLPRTIVSSIRKGKTVDVEDSEEIVTTPEKDLSKYYTRKEFNCSKILKKNILINVDGGKGYVTITANIGEAEASSQLCDIAFHLLEKYVTEFKISKAKTQYEYVLRRYEETKAEFLVKQKALAEFQDANRVISSATAKIELQRLTTDYELSNSIYLEMANQLIQADLQVKQDTPIFTQIKPIVTPLDRTKPFRSLIVMIWTIFGGLFGCALIISLDFLKSVGFPYPKQWDSPFVNE